jgi:DNA-binding NtrC family response regulator
LEVGALPASHLNLEAGNPMKRRVLIIEDDAQMRDMLAISLRRSDFETITSESATAGLEALQSSKFDVVVTDINMRGLDGIEFCRRVAGTHPDLPVIVITAFGSMDTAIAALRAGAVDFIPKPFELEALTAAVQRALEPRGRSAAVEELQKENEFVTLDDLERRYILRVVEALNGNRSLAAQTLGLDRKTLYRKLLLYSGKTKAGGKAQNAQPEPATVEEK